MEGITITWLVQGLLSVLLAVVWFLLRDKDRKQGETLDRLFLLHDEDVKTLTEHRVEIAKNHYTKDELNQIMAGLKEMNREEFQRINTKIDSLSEMLMGMFKRKD